MWDLQFDVFWRVRTRTANEAEIVGISFQTGQRYTLEAEFQLHSFLEFQPLF